MGDENGLTNHGVDSVRVRDVLVEAVENRRSLFAMVSIFHLIT
jgi:hypothetical protein